jgi:hypothetical protein
LVVSARRQSFDFFWSEKETMAGLAHQADISARIVIDDYTKEDFSFVVLLEGFDNCGLTGKGDVHDVTAGSRTKLDPTAGTQLDIRNAQIAHGPLGFQKLPFPFVHGISSFNERSSLSVP